MTGSEARRLRLMSWNIHGCAGHDEVTDADRVAHEIAAFEPDIVAVQEVDTRATGRSGQDIIGLLADVVGEHRAEAYTLVQPDGRYGQAVFSRLPFLASATHDISWRAREPRRVIDVTIAAWEHRLRVLAVHLGLSIKERIYQARLLRETFGGTMDVPTIAMGDFNDWLPFGGIHRSIRRILPHYTRVGTFPGWFPLLPLDRIYASPELRLENVCTDSEAGRASDHLPLIADLVLPPAETAGGQEAPQSEQGDEPISDSSEREWSHRTSPCESPPQ